jgi:DNA-3-methyladenine glycosylase II
MFQLLSLGRPDALPVLDLGIQKAVQRAYGLRARPTPKKIEKIGAAWRPWATVASWYLWRSLDNG